DRRACRGRHGAHYCLSIWNRKTYSERGCAVVCTTWSDMLGLGHWGCSMEARQQSPYVIRFGDFEVDQRAGELRRHGTKVRLQQQPFRVLVRLLERPGELVTREELREAIWAPGTFAEFDGGLDATIHKLRSALGDSAEHPRFVETLPRRGYRFIGGAVEVVAPKARAQQRWVRRWPIVLTTGLTALIALGL